MRYFHIIKENFTPKYKKYALKTINISLYLLLLAIYFICFALVILHNKHNLINNGHPWIQGDWLINSTEIFVRRGSFGSFLIAVSDFFKLNLLNLLILEQNLFFLSTILIICFAIIKIGFSLRVFILLTSSVFFVQFIAIDPDGLLRKEIIMYLAFALLLLSVRNGKINKCLFAFSLCVFSISILFHEGLIFFVPFYYVALYLCWDASLKKFILLISILTCVLILALLVNILPDKLTDTHLVCNPLLDRGLLPEICTGAVGALTFSLSAEREGLWHYILQFDYTRMLYAYAVAILPVIYYFYDGFKTKIVSILICISSGIIFVPLFFIATDWGRWISYYITALTFTLLIAKAKGFSFEPKTFRPFIGGIVLFICLNYGIQHRWIVQIDGIYPVITRFHDPVRELLIENFSSYYKEVVKRL